MTAPNPLEQLDWTAIRCQSETQCQLKATHVVHLHAVGDCDNDETNADGNIVGLLCRPHLWQREVKELT